MRTNFFPRKYGLCCLIAHNTTMTFRSVADRFASPLDQRWLEYPMTRSMPLMLCVSVAPAPSSLASVCSWKGDPHSGDARGGGDVRALTSAARVLSCSSPPGTRSFPVLLDAKRLSLRRFVIGATIELYRSTNLL